MVSKEILIQYSDLQEEIKENRQSIAKIEQRISVLEDEIKKIEDGEQVKDKVRGGLGGEQNFNIEGIPIPEYTKKRSELMTKKLILNNLKSNLEIHDFELLQITNEVAEFIHSIKDSRMRRIINLRFLQNLSWGKVAEKIGGGNTEDSVRMAFNRFMEKQ